VAVRTTIVLLISVLVAGSAHAATDRQTKTVAMTPGRKIVVDVTIGAVRIEGQDRTDAEIVVERQAPSPDLFAKFPILITEEPRRLGIRVVQADGAADPALKADIVIRVPLDVEFDAVKIAEGRLSIDTFRGGITAEVKRGPIDAASITGTTRLETVIGSITVTNARLAPTGLLRLRAFNGDVRLQLAGAPPDARVLALSLNGKIASDFPMTTRDSWGPRWSEATFGKGEPVVSIDVVNGDVDIRTK
jgi:hypothetical protein